MRHERISGVEGGCVAPAITVSAPSGTSRFVHYRFGNGDHLPNGSVVNVVVVDNQTVQQLCSAYVGNGMWTCVAGAIAVSAGKTYTITASSTVDGVTASDTGSFSGRRASVLRWARVRSVGMVDGICRGTGTLECCTGCWDGVDTCETGTTLTVCGGGGALCASCDGGNECMSYACTDNACASTVFFLADGHGVQRRHVRWHESCSCVRRMHGRFAMR
ncbi:MAG: hypothetical protein R3A47_01170 [Polyangiales bacterium]